MKISLTESLLVGYLAALLVGLYVVAATRYQSDLDAEILLEDSAEGDARRAERDRENFQRDPMNDTFGRDGRWNVERNFDHKAHWEFQKRQMALDAVAR